MWRIGRTDTFVRTARRYLRRRPHLEAPLARTLVLLAQDPFDPCLHTHTLSGKLKGFHGVSVTYQVRLVVKLARSGQTVTLIDVGDHAVVYG